MSALIFCSLPDRILIWFLPGNCSRAAKSRCVRRPEVFSSESLVWEALVQGRALCVEKFIKGAGSGCGGRDMSKRRNHILASVGGYIELMFQDETTWKVSTRPRLVPNELPGALSLDVQPCLVWKQVLAASWVMGQRCWCCLTKRKSLGIAKNLTTILEYCYPENVVWWTDRSWFSLL